MSGGPDPDPAASAMRQAEANDAATIAGRAALLLLASSTFIRAGLQYTPRHWVDVGLSLGFDDLAHLGTFGPQGFVALRI